MTDLLRSDGYKWFKGNVPKHKIAAGFSNDQVWAYYDIGPKTAIPVICLHGVAGTCESFYRIFLSLYPRGYRIISLEYPEYWDFDDWITGMEVVLDSLDIGRFHLLGSTLGAFLALQYAKARPDMIESLILVNGFCDTEHFSTNGSWIKKVIKYVPRFYLKGMILANLPTGKIDGEVAQSIDFIVEMMRTIPTRTMASHLILNSINADVVELQLSQDRITLIECLDEVAVPGKLRAQLRSVFPGARVIFLKEGGNFPFLAKIEEFMLYLLVHLRSMESRRLESATADAEAEENGNGKARA